MTDQERESGLGVPIVFSLVLIYFVPIIAILVDELVFGTFYFSQNSPEWVEDVVRTIYWPMIVIVRQLI